jgi:glycerophosphoryl diester phosphodiesterase
MTADRPRLAATAPAIIAHRGSWSHHRENTLEAFVAAYEEGADMVELDVWLSADGVPVVHHDEAVDGVAIGSLSQAQLRSTAAYVPTLDQVFAWAKGRIGVYVELKGPDTSEPVVALVRKHRMADHVVVGSFVTRLVTEVRAADANLRSSVLFNTTDVDAAITLGQQLGVDYLHPCWKNVADRPLNFVQQMKGAGFGIVTWDEDRPEVLQSLLDQPGIEGMCTNLPALLLELRQAAAMAS